MRNNTHPVEADDQLVAVVLILVRAGLDGEVGVRPGDARQQEVDHGPQLLQGVLQRRVVEEDPLLTAKTTDIFRSTAPRGRRCGNATPGLPVFSPSEVEDALPVLLRHVPDELHFVQHHLFPLPVEEMGVVFHQQLVGGQTHVETVGLRPPLRKRTGRGGGVKHSGLFSSCVRFRSFDAG